MTSVFCHWTLFVYAFISLFSARDGSLPSHRAEAVPPEEVQGLPQERWGEEGHTLLLCVLQCAIMQVQMFQGECNYLETEFLIHVPMVPMAPSILLFSGFGRLEIMLSLFQG